jgi:uncharacterized metal-binding protein YceD (DUF177 family)
MSSWRARWPFAKPRLEKADFQVLFEDPIMTSRKPEEGNTPELSRLVTEEALARGAYSLDIEASEDERAALARRFGLLGIDRLKATVSLKSRGEEVLLDGQLEADVTQACVVSLDPVHSTIASRFSVRYMSPDDFADHVADEDEEAFLDPEAEDIEPLPDHGIDVGEVVSQYLMLALDPYPRREGTDLGAVGSEGDDTEARENPFSVLKKLQDRG